ncbi:MAG: hypothetical protein HGA51_01925, partial [Demequinaceae bacterium]|nr:hypothetical protein [Demequinaceae bacterium]
MIGRELSPAAQMRRAGAHDPDRALRLVADIEAVVGATIDDVPKALSYLADPDGGLLNLLRLAESARDKGLLEPLAALRGTTAGNMLGMLLGASNALGDFLVRHPDIAIGASSWGPDLHPDASGARRTLLVSVGADPAY